ncbi:hypothetical protein BKA67DRAFT_141356 [Truncatella angustata]|uniref:Mitochondrial inner membrane protein 1 n=1 Tax=Truncatella angustata TaxID=152316 RepID=A0A9P8RJY6_9PEZI|nr:uncharacterized protein BKA67DRAFT_141356 [Truncatella angustata]KAH6640080.1 hypothetical protein BKA67DRAFT_141356 [Truncatella angustata]
MLRSTRPLWTSSTRTLLSQNAATTTSRLQASQLTSISRSRTPNASTTARVLPLIHKTSYATKHVQDKEDPEEVKKWAEEKLEPHPEAVSSESSVRHFSDFLEPSQRPANKDDPAAAPPVKDGVAHDLNLVKETFSLSTVPKESLYLGLAGTLPYLATSFSNVYLSWALNTEWPTSSNFVNSILMTHDNARYWLGVVEPLQMGYGAVIISFLGAIHWGLEYAEKTPSKPRTQFRYGMGVAASIVAWPTLFLPWQFALTSQFAAFVGLYFADSRATVRGWAPYWYGTYRFVLTAIVGAAIMISIIGRSKIGDTAPRLSGLSEKFHATHGEEPYSNKWANAEQPAKKEYQNKKAEEEKRKQEEEAKKQEEEEAKKCEEGCEERREEG